MKLNYYVLGIDNNSIISTYLDKYYELLISYLIKLSEHNILNLEIKALLMIDNRDFVLNTDYSSVINLLYKEFIEKIPQNINNISMHIEIFKNEINLFLIGDYKNLISNKGKNIPGTNIKLTTNDGNPYNIFDIHPDHKINGNLLGWGEKKMNEWFYVYEKTFELLKKIDIGIYSELNQIIKKIIPLGTSVGIHNSCSYKESIGHLYMGYTINTNTPEINILEGIIHESSHNKLNLIMQFDSIILNNKEEKYYSSIRPDARHIHGVFLGYHAFAPTMYIIMKAYVNGLIPKNNSLFEKIVLYYIKTKFLQKVIKKYAIFTELGKNISEEIDYVIILMDKILRELKPSKKLIKLSIEKQKEHFDLVNSKYDYLMY